MKATQRLHDLGQSPWLDDITRDLLTGGTLHRYIDELSVTGLTANPTIFDHAITKSQAYDAAIRENVQAHRFVRSMGGGAGQGPRTTDHSLAGERGRTEPRT
jgi:hypothetical protein